MIGKVEGRGIFIAIACAKGTVYVDFGLLEHNAKTEHAAKHATPHGKG